LISGKMAKYAPKEEQNNLIDPRENT
jgi:hypothetical protein